MTTEFTNNPEDDSKCIWTLLYSSGETTEIVKQCMFNNDIGCRTIPYCKQFTIEEVEDHNEYILKVYLSTDQSKRGEAKIEKGIYL